MPFLMSMFGYSSRRVIEETSKNNFDKYIESHTNYDIETGLFNKIDSELLTKDNNNNNNNNITIKIIKKNGIFELISTSETGPWKHGQYVSL